MSTTVSSPLAAIALQLYPNDSFVYRSSEDRQLQKIMAQAASLYPVVSSSLRVNQRASPSHHREWHDDLFRDHIFRSHIIYFPYPSSRTPGGGGSTSGGGSCAGGGGSNDCLGILVIAAIAFVLIAIGVGVHKTCKESARARKNQHLLSEILGLHRQLRQVSPEGQVDLAPLHSSLERIEKNLRAQKQFHSSNALFASIGTIGLGLLIVSLVAILLHIYQVPHDIPTEYLAISGGAALAFALIAYSTNSGFRPRINQREYDKDWDAILERAALPMRNLTPVKKLYEAYCGDTNKRFYVYDDHKVWTLESQEGGPEGLLIRCYPDVASFMHFRKSFPVGTFPYVHVTQAKSDSTEGKEGSPNVNIDTDSVTQ